MERGKGRFRTSNGAIKLFQKEILPLTVHNPNYEIYLSNYMYIVIGPKTNHLADLTEKCEARCSVYDQNCGGALWEVQ